MEQENIEADKKRKEYYREYYLKNREKYRVSVNKYRNTPNGKKYVKEYNSRPEVKERIKKWFSEHPNYNRDWVRRKKLEGEECKKKK